MRRVLLLRHAKSSWDHPGLRDFDRPLSPRGETAAPRMGRHLQQRNLVPGLIFCSPAKRTRQTAALVCDQLGSPPTVEIDEELYGAEVSYLMHLIQTVRDDVQTVMIIGHNPETQDLAIHLARQADTAEMHALKSRFPTAALAVIDLDIASWADAGPGRGTLAEFTTPRSLGND